MSKPDEYPDEATERRVRELRQYMDESLKVPRDCQELTGIAIPTGYWSADDS